MPSYNPAAIEPKWQRFWEENKTFRVTDPLPDSGRGQGGGVAKRKYYILDMFPYPSGAGLHVGHPEGYTATDILARYRRMCGWSVLHPMGWDAFGLPAEQYAIETGTHPRETTRKNIETFRRQIKSLGFSYDWDREVDTTDPGYFKWTQWIFLVLFDTWYDQEQQRGRPIAELPIPADIQKQGDAAVRRYRDDNRLAYQAEVPVNWCPALGTVLANEEVVDGKSERGGHPVVRMPLRQWMLRITAYAERLLADIEKVDWPEPIKGMQRNWIGRSEGAEVEFKLATFRREAKASSDRLRVFTTRPDTLFGATYMVLAPEHQLVDLITTPDQRDAVQTYKSDAARKSDFERTELAKKKTGVFTGAYAINPANNARIPIWIADYVLSTYGTGAIMAVPGQDERDWEFAEIYNLPIIRTVQPQAGWGEPGASAPGGKAYLGDGPAINSDFLNGLHMDAAKAKIIAWLEEKGLGKRKINYKLRDWLFSRQRYWGEPFPILHEVNDKGEPTGVIEPLTLDELPLKLPELADYKPSGKPEPPLGKATAWVNVTRKGKKYKRETNTMPQWAGSCWYYLRYLDPKNPKAFCDREKEKHWLPVDLYVGGAEHAVLHLLYSRFWHKVLFDRGYVSTPEPFQRLVNQGMILGVTYYITPELHREHAQTLTKLGIVAKRDRMDDAEAFILGNPGKERDQIAPLKETQVTEKDGKFFLLDTPIEMTAKAEKMSKSRGNVINPDDVIGEYGADSMRLYEMFMGPLEATKPWSMRGVEGVYRFLSRVWRLTIEDRADAMQLAEQVKDCQPDKETLRKLHQTIKKVTEDLDGMRFNTAIAAMMEFSNHLNKLDARPRSVLESFIVLLSPFAPHLGEELWHALGHQDTLAYAPWPVFDPAQTQTEEIERPVQINGKVRLRISTHVNASGEVIRAHPSIQEAIKGREVKAFIVKPSIVSIVLGGVANAKNSPAETPGDLDENRPGPKMNG